MPKLEIIGFDADDTLWENETYYRITEERFTSLLSDHADPDHLSERLLAAERRNIEHYGYGIKGFTLSMVETAIEVTDGAVPASVISHILQAGRDLLAHPLELLPDVEDVLEQVTQTHIVTLITKGDLFDQERKLAQSGLAELFTTVEIVSEKNSFVYERVFGNKPSMMVGNSMKSDIIPAIEAGAWGVHIPHDLEWAFEKAAPPVQSERFHQLGKIRELPALIGEIERN